MIQIDMDMPRNCAECPFCTADQYLQDYCCITQDRLCELFDGRDDDCPLREVKKNDNT